MSIDLDPREVLKYLNQLGYCNITKEQLKEFIYDLKKLVKYDDSTTEFDSPQPQNIPVNRPNPTPVRRRPSARPTRVLGTALDQHSGTLEDLIAPCNTTDSSYNNINGIATSQGPASIGKENVGGRKQQQREKSYASSTTGTTNSSGSESVSLSSNSSSPSSLDIFNTKGKLPESSRGSGNGKHVKNTKTTSFIRPWRLVSAPVKSVPDQRRTDPVSLYHHYQTIWKRQKLPGEDNRAELRWSIREKMLGQDPHPRPASQASSVEYLKRHQTKK